MSHFAVLIVGIAYVQSSLTAPFVSFLLGVFFPRVGHALLFVRDQTCWKIWSFSMFGKYALCIRGNPVVSLHSFRWTFSDGLGRSFARFNIDLYYCGGGCSLAGNCGEIIARLCEVR